jgi:hypothetical protein
MREYQNMFDLDGAVEVPRGVTIESVRKVQKLVAEAKRGDMIAEATLKQGLIRESAITGEIGKSVGHFLNLITIPQLPEDKDRPVAKLATFETVPDFRPAILYGLFGDLTGPGIEPDGALAIVPQGTPFPEVTVTGVESAYGKLRKRGARIGWDFEDFINDTIGVLDRIPSQLRDVALETEWQEVGDALIQATTTAGVTVLPDGTSVPDNAAISVNAIMAAIQALAARTVNGTSRKIGTLSSYKIVVPVGQKVFVDWKIREALGIMYVLPGSSGGAVRPGPDYGVLANVEVIEHSKVTGTKWYLLPTPGTFSRPSLSVLRLRGYETPQLLTRSGDAGGFSFDSDTAAMRLRLVVGGALWFQNAIVYSAGTA